MTGPLSGKVVAILAEDLFEDLELWYPVLRLKAAQADVRIVGTSHPREYRGRNGLSIDSDVASSEVEAKEFDAVVIPGGYAPDRMRRDHSTVNLVREMNRLGKPIGAICHAGWMLVEAGILEDREMTCFFSIRKDVENAGARFRDAEVVRDTNLITSRSPADLPAFGEALVEAIQSA